MALGSGECDGWASVSGHKKKKKRKGLVRAVVMGPLLPHGIRLVSRFSGDSLAIKDGFTIGLFKYHVASAP
ncbi:hypothetical protein RRF57_011193 [Xylaria bambusicola]|uniref:Uncharacterized protein n=1 Tax=Xylaria bambusicola TaxID=326684 RepID=A0AAN7ZCZ1_9PEZI